MADTGTKSVKRFGARYGRNIKFRFGLIENEQRKNHKCPYCNVLRVKRISTGIWGCKKCGAKFTGKAYTLAKKTAKEEELESLDESIKRAEELKKIRVEEAQKELEEENSLEG